MRPGAILLFAMLALPAAAQGLPEITPDETAAAVAAVEAADLSETAYRSLWCAARFDLRRATEAVAAETVAAEQSAAARDALYRKAAVELFAGGLAESDFTAVAEDVHRVALSQIRAADVTARDYTNADCDVAPAL